MNFLLKFVFSPTSKQICMRKNIFEIFSQKQMRLKNVILILNVSKYFMISTVFLVKIHKLKSRMEKEWKIKNANCFP